MSAWRVIDGMSVVLEWQTVTVASAPDCFCMSMAVDGLADDLAASDDDDVLTRRVMAVANEHLANTGGSRGSEPFTALGQQADVEGVEGVHVLLGVDGLDDGILIDMIGQRQLDKDAVNVRIVAETTYLGY